MKYQNFQTRFTNVIDGNKALMFLYGVIGDEIDSFYFASEMYYNKAMGREIVVKINSEGGNVHDGNALIDAIIECGANTHIVGMAASMAGVISQFGNKRIANSNASLMIHGVGGTKNDELKKMVEKQLADMLISRSKLTAEDVKNIMESKPVDGKWYNAEDMAKLNLVDEVVPVQAQNPFQNGTKNNFREIFPNLGKSVQLYAKLIGDKPNNEMEITAIASKLGVEAKEDAVNAKLEAVLKDAGEVNNLKATIKTLEGSESTLKEENAKLTEKVANLEQSTKDNLAKAAKVLVSNAVKSGKISAADESVWVESAVENFERTSKMIEAMRPGFKSVAASVENNAQVLDQEETYEKLAKNNPEKLKEIAEKDPARFEQLVKAHNKK